MKIGNMNSLVTFQKPTSTTDETTGQIGETVWADHCTRWAKVRPLRASELSEFQGQSVEDIRFKIFVRKDEKTEQVDRTYRVLVNGKVISIQSAYEVDLSGDHIAVNAVERR